MVIGAGGLAARYIIYLLYKNNFLKSKQDQGKIQAGHYISIACPHLGIQNNQSANPILSIFGMNELISKFTSMDQLTMDLMLVPRKGQNEPLLLQVITIDNLILQHC